MHSHKKKEKKSDLIELINPPVKYIPSFYCSTSFIASKQLI